MSKGNKIKDNLKPISSKKSSFNQLNHKLSINDVLGLDFYSFYHKMNDNFMVDMREETRFELEDAKASSCKAKKESKEALSSF